jgi:hypothetical protein
MILPKKIQFSKHQNKAEFKNLDDSEVLGCDFPGLKTTTTPEATRHHNSRKILFLLPLKLYNHAMEIKQMAWTLD